MAAISASWFETCLSALLTMRVGFRDRRHSADGAAVAKSLRFRSIHRIPRNTPMPVTRLLSLAVLLLALAVPATLSAQDSVKKTGKLICGSFSAKPKAAPPWNEAIAVEIAHGAITVVRT